MVTWDTNVNSFESPNNEDPTARFLGGLKLIGIFGFLASIVPTIFKFFSKRLLASGLPAYHYSVVNRHIEMTWRLTAE